MLAKSVNDVPVPASASTLVMAAVRVVLPWSMWPIVPTLTWGLLRSNVFLAMGFPSSSLTRVWWVLESERSLAADAGDDRFLHECRRLLVRVELHRVRGATLGARTQVGSVAEHLGQRHRAR